MDKREAYNQKEKEAQRALREAISSGGGISLVPKNTTHVMRERRRRPRLNLRGFNQVIAVDPDKREAEVEGCTRFYDLAQETLKFGLIPKVVPEFRGITIGGTVSGIGVESSSFKYGITQETLKDITLLTATGEVVTFSKESKPDLWNTLPNSFGSLGYVLKCTAHLIPAKKYVKITVEKYADAREYFERMDSETKNPKNDFVDGVIFGEGECVLVLGIMTDDTNGSEPLNLVTDIYYEKLRHAKNNAEYVLHTFDYLFRWDKDAFWGMESYPILKFFLHNVFLRATILRPLLRTDRLLDLKKKRDRVYGLWKRIRHPWNPPRSEELIQDFGVDIKKGAEFTEWYNRQLPIYPLWVCPMKKMVPKGTYPLFDFDCDMILDMGFYAKTDLKPGMAEDHYLRMGEKKMHEMGGMKGLYSRNTYSEEEFWQIYNRDGYREIKKKYDPEGIFPDVYAKISTG